MPANPPPMITTCGRGSDPTRSASPVRCWSVTSNSPSLLPSRPSVRLQPHRLPPPPREPDHVLHRRHRVLVRVGGLHPPAQVGRVGQRQEGRNGPPPPAPE